jgi:flagellar FliJ protein
VNRRFRLRTLERLRQVALDDAARALGEARRALTEARREVEELELAMAGCVAGAAAGSGELVAAAAARQQLRDRIETATAEVSRRGIALQTAVEAWGVARAGLRAVEKLHERHRLALAEADARRDQRISDDLAVSMLRAAARTPGREGAR